MQDMARTKASAAASTTSYPSRRRTLAQLQEAQEPDSDPDYEMEDAGDETHVEETKAHDPEATDPESTDTESDND